MLRDSNIAQVVLFVLQFVRANGAATYWHGVCS